jgi:hypothetical protein
VKRTGRRHAGRLPDDRRVWNALGGITTILEDGDLLIGGAFGHQTGDRELTARRRA